MNATKKIKILLLDDEYLVRMSVAARLRKTNFEIVSVATPEEAVVELKKGRFQAILTDVIIGSVDGFMFRDIVRGMNREIPLIFFTSLMNDDGNKFLYRVMEDAYSTYLPKNAPNDILIRHLEQVTRSARAEIEVARLNGERDTTMRLASFVQTALLPQWARQTESLFYSVCWKPFARVSGDLYEWLPVSKSSALFVFGDISGHGISASLAMTAVQSYLKQFAALRDSGARDVAKIATSISQFIFKNLAGVAYMSGLVVYINALEKRIRVCNAGHPDLYCYTRAGERIILNPEERGGMPFGIVENVTYSENDVVDKILPPDAVLFALSDGITDLSADEEGEEYVPQELLEELMRENVKSLSDQSTLTPIVLPYRINSMLSDFGYTHRQDDMSLAIFGFTQSYTQRICIESQMDCTHIDQTLRQINEKLATFPMVSADLAARVEILLNEFLVNLHDHGCQDVTRHKRCAHICISVINNHLAITVWHRTHAWEPGDMNLSPDTALEHANATMSSHGRGVAIIRKLCQSMSVQTFAGLNANTFYLPLTDDATPHE